MRIQTFCGTQIFWEHEQETFQNRKSGSKKVQRHPKSFNNYKPVESWLKK